MGSEAQIAGSFQRLSLGITFMLQFIMISTGNLKVDLSTKLKLFTDVSQMTQKH